MIFKAVRFATAEAAEHVEKARDIENLSLSKFVSVNAAKLAHMVNFGLLKPAHLLPPWFSSNSEITECVTLLAPQEELRQHSKRYVDALVKYAELDKAVATFRVLGGSRKVVYNPTPDVYKKLSQVLGEKIGLEESQQSRRTNITLTAAENDQIERAAKRVHLAVSPFLAWAAITEAVTVTGEPLHPPAYLPSIERKLNISSRFPVEAIYRLDELAYQEGCSRSVAINRAIKYLSTGIAKGRVNSHLLGRSMVKVPDFSLDIFYDYDFAPKKMVNYAVDKKMRVAADTAAAQLHHTFSSFVSWAVMDYCRDFCGRLG